MRLTRLTREAGSAACVLALAAMTSLAGCAGGNGNTSPNHPQVDLATQIDSDPVALLPGMAAAVATIDDRALLASGAGSALGQLTDMLLPLGPETGFVASRDVDRITLGAYLLQGADVVAVVNGRFDPAHIDQAAQAHVATRNGGFLTPTQYGGRNLYVVSEGAFTILTPHTALAGTQTAVRRAIDRVQGLQGRTIQREIAKWMADTLDTVAPAAGGASGAQGPQGPQSAPPTTALPPGAPAPPIPQPAFAVAADLTNQPVGQILATAPFLNGPWLNGLISARILGDFHDPGFNTAGTLAYASPQQAQGAANSLRGLGAAASVASALSSMVPQLRGLAIDVNGTNLQAKFAIDDQSLRRVLQSVAQQRPPQNGPHP